MEDMKPEEVQEPIALAVEPELQPEENRALHGSTMKAEAPVVEPTPEPEVQVKVDKNAGLPGAGIFVQLSALIPHSRRKNSRSVTSVQARLIELGYITAGDDDRGHFSNGTVEALDSFVKDKKIKADSLVDETVIKTLFKGTAVEVVA